ncbi:phosphatidylglycerophosphatase A [Methanobrevibacter sp.]|uniref:phosphatidylglycerophosphatase A n=1 Tax=Methanobrevibacter sp. TaxID=66852 RepID=UPI002602C3F7|nr:phosphatidylglycerophosphatase A [uncultured Methanobrevibacter sp.]
MKNSKSKFKTKRRTSEIFNDITLYSDYDYFYMENPNYFLTFSDVADHENQINNGIDIIKNIIILSPNYDIKNNFETSIKHFENEKKIESNLNDYGNYNTYIAQQFPIDPFINENNDETKNKKNDIIPNNNINYFLEKTDKISIINFINSNLNLIKISDNLQVAKVKRDSNSIELNLSQIIYIDESLNLKELIQLYKIAVETKIKYFDYLKLPEHIQDALNNNESLILACKSPINFKKGKKQNLMKLINENDKQKEISTNENLENLENIKKELVNSMVKSCSLSLEKTNLSFGILDYILAEGITIDLLVDAGMELCVGIDETPERIKELRLRLKNQILKSLEDINVIALLISAIRCEEDFKTNRVREVDVSDDPAYLYTDEVLGIAIANQIAGTKATFNFKRYDEEKPGILSKLGPMVDDIFAGLIAGCMSKIFEEEY